MRDQHPSNRRGRSLWRRRRRAACEAETEGREVSDSPEVWSQKLQSSGGRWFTRVALDAARQAARRGGGWHPGVCVGRPVDGSGTPGHSSFWGRGTMGRHVLRLVDPELQPASARADAPGDLLGAAEGRRLRLLPVAPRGRPWPGRQLAQPLDRPPQPGGGGQHHHRQATAPGERADRPREGSPREHHPAAGSRWRHPRPGCVPGLARHERGLSRFERGSAWRGRLPCRPLPSRRTPCLIPASDSRPSWSSCPST